MVSAACASVVSVCPVLPAGVLRRRLLLGLGAGLVVWWLVAGGELAAVRDEGGQDFDDGAVVTVGVDYDPLQSVNPAQSDCQLASGYVVAELGDLGGILAVDETGFAKKGVRSARVARGSTPAPPAGSTTAR